MRKWIFVKSTVFFLVPISLLFLSGLFLPPTPRASTSLLFANVKKDSLLQHSEGPRIIFVGGSNLSFGLNSQTIRDSLGLYPINTGVNAAVGLKYMLENTLQYVKEGDKIILSIEYELFYKHYDQTSDVLLRTIVDVFPEKWKDLSLSQKFRLIPYLPRFSLTKLNPTEYVAYSENQMYGGNTFNEYGDAVSHWNLNGWDFRPANIGGQFNMNVIHKMKEFESAVNQKEGEVLITFPGLDEVTFQKNRHAVLQVERNLKQTDFTILGSSERYVFPGEMMFDTHYHLIKEGVDVRTKRLIYDYLQTIEY